MSMADPTRSAQFEEFFMSKKGGKRKCRLGFTSVIDELILGRDTDASGDDPHRDFMAKFGDHAGLMSGHEVDNRKKPGHSMTSTMDTVIWGRDFDQSGADPHDIFKKSFPKHAGVPSGEFTESKKKPGYAMTSTMDSLIWGRDFDQSGEDPYEQFSRTFRGHAGGLSSKPDKARSKKFLVGGASVMDEVLTGEDKDGSGDIQEKYAKMFDGLAGKSSGPAFASERPFRKVGMSMKSSVDNVIWGRDLDHSGDDFQEEHLATFFEGCAGNPSNHKLGCMKLKLAASANIAARKQQLAERRAARKAAIDAIPSAPGCSSQPGSPRTPRRPPEATSTPRGATPRASTPRRASESAPSDGGASESPQGPRASTPRRAPGSAPGDGGAATPRRASGSAPSDGGASTPRRSSRRTSSVGGAATPRWASMSAPSDGGASESRQRQRAWTPRRASGSAASDGGAAGGSSLGENPSWTTPRAMPEWDDTKSVCSQASKVTRSSSRAVRGSQLRCASDPGLSRRTSLSSCSTKPFGFEFRNEDLPPQLRGDLRSNGSRRSSIASYASSVSSNSLRPFCRPSSKTGSMGSLTSRDYGSFHNQEPAPAPPKPMMRPRTASICSTVTSMTSSSYA